MQFSDIITETGASKITATDAFDFDGVNAALSTINQRLDQFASNLESRGITEIKKRYFVEARYRFQVWELEVEIKTGFFKDAVDVEALITAFHKMHERVFAITDMGQAVECLNWRGRLIADVEAPSLEPLRSNKPNHAEADRIRKAYFGKEPIDTPIYLGDDLNTGVSIDGPAIIEEPTSTLVVNPGANVKVSTGGRYILTPSEHGLV
jgi:N-methylhydantoinase A